MASSQLRAARPLTRLLSGSRRSFGVSAFHLNTSTPATTKTETPATSETQPTEINQAPNRVGVWSRSQKPRSQAMTGPRFEQTDFSLQV
jgi:NADH dehydrogenase (ubiquinone) Fe-S protein 6